MRSWKLHSIRPVQPVDSTLNQQCLRAPFGTCGARILHLLSIRSRFLAHDNRSLTQPGALPRIRDGCGSGGGASSQGISGGSAMILLRRNHTACPTFSRSPNGPSFREARSRGWVVCPARVRVWPRTVWPLGLILCLAALEGKGPRIVRNGAALSWTVLIHDRRAARPKKEPGRVVQHQSEGRPRTRKAAAFIPSPANASPKARRGRASKPK